MKSAARAAAEAPDSPEVEICPFLGHCPLLRIEPTLDLAHGFAFDGLHALHEGFTKLTINAIVSADFRMVAVPVKYLDHLCRRIKCDFFILLHMFGSHDIIAAIF
jgi:hypothetical protein